MHKFGFAKNMHIHKGVDDRVKSLICCHFHFRVF